MIGCRIYMFSSLFFFPQKANNLIFDNADKEEQAKSKFVNKWYDGTKNAWSHWSYHSSSDDSKDHKTKNISAEEIHAKWHDHKV